MKKPKHFFSASFLLISISVFGQNQKSGVGSDPFAKDNWSFDLNRIAAYNRTNIYKDDDKVSGQSNGTLNLQGMYFLTKGFGLGLNYSSAWNCEDQFSTSSQSLGANFQYGMSIGTSSYIYGRIGGGLGWGKDIDRVPGSDNNVEYKNNSNNINAGIGLPIRLQSGGHTYFTPEISWNRNSTDYQQREVVENTFGLGIKLQTYLSPAEFNCGKKIDASTINNRYNRGSQFIDFNSSGLYSITKQKTTYDVSPLEFESDISGGDLMVNYGLYVFDNFAVGAGVGFNTNKCE